MQETMRVAELFVASSRLATALGAGRIDRMPGCWTHTGRSDPAWFWALNGHRDDEIVAGPDGGMQVFVPPMTVGVWHHGLLLTLCGIDGGATLGGSEDAMLEATRRELAAVHIQEVNDDYLRFCTPAGRWERMRSWLVGQRWWVNWPTRIRGACRPGGQRVIEAMIDE